MEGVAGGDGVVAGCGLLPTDTARFVVDADVVVVVTVVFAFGDGKRRGVGDLYLELTSR